MMTDQDQFRRIEELFAVAVGMAGDERAAYLNRECAGDDALRRGVEALLRADSGPGSSRLDRGVGVRASDVLGGALWRDPEWIAGYRVVRRIGAGGMGVVYEAEQERPARRVAIKLLRAERLTEAGVRRMEFEGEVLGRLSHPGIATVFEAGVWADAGVSRPFVAMELVEGAPITDHASGAALGLRERLALMARVCDAAHHAHQRGVIHRDLKPGNILVNTGGDPKIVDFGIAGDLGGAAADAGRAVTQTGQLLGTLAYMAPERLSGGRVTDARSDIYSLGVVLYELLAGRLPHGFAADAPGSLTDAVRRVTETDPSPLGAADPALRGDVEIIASAALSRDPERRYASAAAMAEDIRRLLADLPILARRPSTVYQVRKFAHRNRGLVAAGTVLVLGIVAGVAGIGLGLREAVAQREVARAREREAEAALGQAEVERERAQQQASIATAINSFINMDLLAQAAREGMGRDVTVKQAVDAAALTLDDRFENEPIVRASIRNSIAGIYDSLSEYGPAEVQYRRAVDEFVSAGPDGADLAELARQDLGRMYRRLSRYDEALEILVPLQERLRAQHGPSDERALRALIDLAAMRSDLGDFDGAFALLEQFDRDRAGFFGDDSSVVIRAVEARGNLYFNQRRFELAAADYARVAAFREQDDAKDNDELTPLANLAAAYEGLGRFDEAEPIYRRVLEIERRLGGPDNLEALATAYNLAFLLESMGRYDEAEPLYRDTLERCTRVLGPTHDGTLSCTAGLSSLLRETGRGAEGRGLLEDAWVLAVETFGEGAGVATYLGGNLGLLCGEIGDHDRAIEVLGRVVPLVAASLGPDHPRVGHLMLAEGRSMHRLGRLAEGRERLVAGRAIVVAVEGEDNPGVGIADRLIAEIDGASAPAPDGE
jgi:serine/threonine protein kinase